MGTTQSTGGAADTKQTTAATNGATNGTSAAAAKPKPEPALPLISMAEVAKHTTNGICGGGGGGGGWVVIRHF